MLFTLEHEPQTIQLYAHPRINGAEVQRVPVLKYLGVLLDSKLSFGPYVELQSVRAKRAIGALYRTLGKWTNREVFKVSK